MIKVHKFVTKVVGIFECKCKRRELNLTITNGGPDTLKKGRRPVIYEGDKQNADQWNRVWDNTLPFLPLGVFSSTFKYSSVRQYFLLVGVF